MTGKVHIGTSGWHYKQRLGDFYPAETKPSEMLAFYAEQFDTVEINNTFYRLPSEQTVDLWREASPTTFCFAVKANRFITHMKKLKDPDSSTIRTKSWSSGLTESSPGVETCLRFMSTSTMTWVAGR